MKVDAVILVTEHKDFRGGRERVEWSWQGGSVVEVQDRLLSEFGNGGSLNNGSNIDIGPFRLKIVDRRLEKRSYIAVRSGFKGTVKYTLYQATKHVDFIYRRLILTAAVWGLARYSDYSIPTWEDIYLLAKLKRRLWKS